MVELWDTCVDVCVDVGVGACVDADECLLSYKVEDLSMKTLISPVTTKIVCSILHVISLDLLRSWNLWVNSIVLPLLLGLMRGQVAGGMQTYCGTTLDCGWVVGSSRNDYRVQEIMKPVVQINVQVYYFLAKVLEMSCYGVPSP